LKEHREIHQHVVQLQPDHRPPPGGLGSLDHHHPDLLFFAGDQEDWLAVVG
jgi:hypothetical protein